MAAETAAPGGNFCRKGRGPSPIIGFIQPYRKVSAVGWHNHVDFELHEEIEDLVDEGELEQGTPAYGIAQQVIHRGLDSLSPKQRWVWDTIVAPALERREKELRLLEIVNSAAP
jgi:hypothetical protein